MKFWSFSNLTHLCITRGHGRWQRDFRVVSTKKQIRCHISHHLHVISSTASQRPRLSSTSFLCELFQPNRINIVTIICQIIWEVSRIDIMRQSTTWQAKIWWQLNCISRLKKHKLNMNLALSWCLVIKIKMACYSVPIYLYIKNNSSGNEMYNEFCTFFQPATINMVIPSHNKYGYSSSKSYGIHIYF